MLEHLLAEVPLHTPGAENMGWVEVTCLDTCLPRGILLLKACMTALPKVALWPQLP